MEKHAFFVIITNNNGGIDILMNSGEKRNFFTKVCFKNLIISLVFFTTCAQLLAATALKSLINDSKAAVVYIKNYGSDGKARAQGTGFFINSSGHVATNLHCVFDASDISVKTAEGKEYRIDKVINTDVDSDLVVFSLKGLDSRKSYLRFSNGKAEVGDEILVIGNPMGLEQTASNGIVSAVRDLPEFGSIYQITAPVSPGSSGGPVIDYSGNVVGVVTMQYKEGQNLNFIVPAYKLLRLMKSARNIMTFTAWRKGGVGYMPGTSEGLLRLGFIYYGSKQYTKAMDCAGKIIKKDPKFGKAWYLAGRSAYEIGNKDYAFKAMQHAYAVEPDLISVHNELGGMYEKSNMISEATEEYFLEIENHPENPDPYYNLATLYQYSGAIEDAIDILKQGIVKCESTSILHTRLGLLYLDLEDSSSAIMEFSTAISLDKLDPDGYYGMGLAYLVEGKKDEAMKIYMKLKDLDEQMAAKLFSRIHQ